MEEMVIWSKSIRIKRKDNLGLNRSKLKFSETQPWWVLFHKGKVLKVLPVILWYYIWNRKVIMLIRLPGTNKASPSKKVWTEIIKDSNICIGNSDILMIGLQYCVYGVVLTEWKSFTIRVRKRFWIYHVKRLTIEKHQTNRKKLECYTW